MYDNVPGAVLTILIAVTWFIVYLPKPRMWNYKLKGSRLTIVRAPRRGSGDELILDLNEYRAFTNEVLLPDHRMISEDAFFRASSRRRMGLHAASTFL